MYVPGRFSQLFVPKWCVVISLDDSNVVLVQYALLACLASGRWPDGDLSEGYGHDGAGVCLGDGQTEAEGVPSQNGRGDALVRRIPPYLT